MAAYISPGLLHWLPPPDMDQDRFRDILESLNRVLEAGEMRQVYTIGRRSVFKADSPELGPLAIKEVIYERAFKRFKMRYFREAKPLREFRVGAMFHARGGSTPESLAAATQDNLLGLKRILLFIRWVENSMTLTDYVKQCNGQPGAVFWQALAKHLADGAHRGLVHGGHSSENILVVTAGDDWNFYTIDFSESILYEDLHAEGFARDIARIAHRMTGLEACSTVVAEEFIEQVVFETWGNQPDRNWKQDIVARMYDFANAS